MKQVHVVLHTHWDREWYFTTSDSLVLLDHVLTDIINVLEKNQQLTICLDAQISIIEDYLSIRPEKKDRLKKLVQDHQLIVGPWYTQTDLFYVHEQSIVNNLYDGIYESKRLFNTFMKIAYLPDTFGFSGQLPMLASGFTIDKGIIWRGVDFEKDHMEPYFIWQSISLDEMKTAVLHGGYGAFKKANSSDVFINKQLRPLLNEIASLTKQQQILMPVGNDQHNINQHMSEYLKTYGDHFHLSTYEDFFTHFDHQVAPLFNGEFRNPRYARVHRTSGGIRIDIKKSNYRAEQQLLRVLQPLLVIARELGIDSSNKIASIAWKKLFEGHAHDSIVGCVSDEVAKDILSRNKQVYELAKSQENLIKKLVSYHADTKENQIILFNLTSHLNNHPQMIELMTHSENIEFENIEYAEIIESTFVEGNQHALIEKPEGNYYQKEADYYIHKVLIKDEFLPLGYKILTFNSNSKKQMIALNDEFIGNNDYQFFINDNQLVLKTKNMRYDHFIRIIDRGNAGDTYDFSPTDLEALSIEFKMIETEIKKTKHYQEMVLEFSAMLPKTLTDRMNGNYNTEANATVKIVLIENELPKITLVYENTVYNHQLRIGFQTKRGATSSIASTPFGFVKRPVINESDLLNWQENYVEIPIDIHPNSGIIGTNNHQLWILNKGVKEYQVVDDTIYLTCLSSTDELGKSDLLYRPGRASGDVSKKGHIRIFTPMAQVLGKHQFEFAIGELPSITEATVQFEKFENIPCFYQNQTINLFYERIDNKIDIINEKLKFPKEASFNVHFEKDFILSHYISKYNQDPMIRIYSLVDREVPAYIHKNFIICNLLEEKIRVLKFKAYKLYTLRRKQDEI